jgi:hypothetical protein
MTNPRLPLTDTATIGTMDCHNLITQGLIDRTTGLKDLKVYVEYYHASALDGMFSTADSQTFWKQTVSGLRGDADLLAESPMETGTPGLQMNLAEAAISLRALGIRILITWSDQFGATRRHELVLARRK